MGATLTSQHVVAEPPSDQSSNWVRPARTGASGANGQEKSMCSNSVGAVGPNSGSRGNEESKLEEQEDEVFTLVLDLPRDVLRNDAP